MKQDAKQHCVSPQGIQIMIAGFIQVYEFVIGQSTPSISNMLGELRSHPSNPAMTVMMVIGSMKTYSLLGLKGVLGV
jgi:hypothetical protein